MPLVLDRLDDRTAPAVLGTTTLAFDQGGTNADTAAAVAVQADGKIVVVGTAVAGPTDTDFAIARFNPDGTFDTTFGVGGKRVVGFDLAAGNIDRATGVAIDGNGNIVVVGTVQVSATDFDFGICRLLPNGDLDPAFDGDGRKEVAFDRGGSNLDTATGVAIDSQNRVVVVGTVQAGTTDTDFGIARLTNGGVIDTTFGSGGTQVIGFDLGGTNADTAAAVAVDSFDRIVVGGTVQIDTNDTDFAVVRLTSVGNLDATFDTDGRATVAFDLGGTNADTLTGFVVLDDARLILTGTVTADAAGDTDIGVARLNASGGLDTGFGTTGLSVVGFDRGGANRDTAAGVTVDRYGRIVVAAMAETPVRPDIVLVRLTSGGVLDTAFSPDGRQTVPLDQNSPTDGTAAGVVALPNDRLAVVGTYAVAPAGDTDIGLVRLSAGTGLSQSVAAGGPADGRVQRFLAGVSTSGSGLAVESVFGAGITVRPATADLNGDGIVDGVYGVGPGGGSEVLLRLGGTTPTDLRFDAFEPSFTGGVFVAAADIDADGRAEVIVSPDRGGGGRVQIFGVQNGEVVLLDNFFGIDDPAFRGGARVAAGDVDGDGFAEVVVGAGFLGGPRVAVFDGVGLLRNQTAPPKLVGDFFAFPGDDATRLRNGVFLTVGDLTGDGKAELIFGGGPGGGPRVLALNGSQVFTDGVGAAQSSPVLNFFVDNLDSSRGGVRVAVADVDGDQFADLIAASGDNLPAMVRTYANPFGTLPSVEPADRVDVFPFDAAVIPGGVFVG